MTLTYPENIRLLGPSTWEEIESQQTTHRQTHRQTTGIQPPTLSHAHFLPTHFAHFWYPSLARYARSAWITSLPNSDQNVEVKFIKSCYDFSYRVRECPGYVSFCHSLSAAKCTKIKCCGALRSLGTKVFPEPLTSHVFYPTNPILSMRPQNFPFPINY